MNEKYSPYFLRNIHILLAHFACLSVTPLRCITKNDGNYKLTITVEELKSIMDPIVGLFPRRFLWKLNQTEPVRARKHISSWDFLQRVDSRYF